MSSQILCFLPNMAKNGSFGQKGQKKNGQRFLPGGHPLRRKQMLATLFIQKHMFKEEGVE
jgi:hypothetical protein